MLEHPAVREMLDTQIKILLGDPKASVHTKKGETSRDSKGDDNRDDDAFSDAAEEAARARQARTDERRRREQADRDQAAVEEEEQFQKMREFLRSSHNGSGVSRLQQLLA